MLDHFLDTVLTLDDVLDRVARRLAGHDIPPVPNTHAPYMFMRSSATTSTPHSTPVSLAALEEEAETVALLIWAHGLAGMPWSLVQSSNQAAKNLLRLGKLGIRADSWLYFNDACEPASSVCKWLEAFDRGPKRITPYNGVALAALARHAVILDVMPAQLARPLFARRDVRAVIRTGGEPVTLPSRPRVLLRYSMSEAGPVGLPCPRDLATYHVLTDRFDVTPGRIVPRSTSARRTEGFAADAFDRIPERCGCKLDEIGLTMRIRNIRRAL